MAANRVECAAAMAAPDVLVDEKLSDRASEMRATLTSKLRAAKPPYVVRFDGAGLFVSIVFDEKRPAKVKPRRVASQRGVLASAAGLHRIRMCPPLTASKEELLEGAIVISKSYNRGYRECW